MRRLTAVDDRDRHKNTSPTADRTHQVGDDRQETEDGTAERRRGGDDALELLVHGLLAVAGHDEALVLELLGDVARAGAGDLDPGLGEDCAGNEHVDDEDGGLQGVGESLSDAERRGPISCQSREEWKRTFVQRTCNKRYQR